MSGNNLKTIPIMIVTLVIGFIMVTAAVMPLAADYSEAKTFTNEGYVRLDSITDEDTTTYNISWLRSSPNIIKVNDDNVKLHPVSGTYTFTVIADTNWIVRASVNTGVVVNMQYYASSGGVLSAGDSLNVTLSQGSMSLETANGTTRTGTYTSAYIPNSNGDMIMKYADKTAYILPDSLIYGYGITRTYEPVDSGSPGYGLIVSGTMDDGITVEKWRGSENISFSNQTINKSEVTTYKDLYEFSSVTFTGTVTATVEEETVTGDNEITYSYVMVPYQVTAIPDNPDTFKNLIRIVPLISIVALVAMAAGFVYFKGKE